MNETYRIRNRYTGAGFAWLPTSVSEQRGAVLRRTAPRYT